MSSGLRFLFVTTFYPPYHFGGDAICAYRLAQALAEAGHRVDVVHSEDAFRLQHPKDPEQTYRHHDNIRIHALRSPNYKTKALLSHQLGQPALYGRQLRDIFGAHRFDVIHYHNISLVGGPGVLGLKGAGNPVKLYTAHEYWLVCPMHVLFAFDREACTQKACLRCTLHYRRPPQLWRLTGAVRRNVRHIDSFIMPSRFALERHRADGIDRPMVHIPHFIPEPTIPAPPARATTDPYFLYVGRLEKLKGVQDLIHLFRDYSGASLLIAGEGDYREELERQARGLENVHFLGRVHAAEMGGLYRDALAVLVPSLCYEVFCLIPYEAFACGTPAIVRRIGALTEVVDQSGAGFAFDSLAECRQAMERIRTDSGLREAMGEKAHAAARRNWTRETHLRRYLELVRNLMADR